MSKRPIQVYLDGRDRAQLDGLARRLRCSKAEVVREAIRRWAVELTGQGDPLLQLVGGLDDPGVPADLSTRLDEYAVGGYRPARVAEPRPGGGTGK
jgi:hypothetical protein